MREGREGKVRSQNTYAKEVVCYKVISVLEKRRIVENRDIGGHAISHREGGETD